jgi:ABC-type bacteriocin/lantibiotic exporter with double-glycine peptidase domain
MLLSNFTHRQQRRESDCLIACAEMVLNYLGIPLSHERLARLLRAGAAFTPFTNLRYLASLGLSITLGEHGDLSIFEPNLELGLPVVVGVQTLLWGHWQGEVTRHAVVVVGIDREHGVIYINDPFFPHAPIEMSLLRFEIGWQEKDREYAIIGLTSPENERQR